MDKSFDYEKFRAREEELATVKRMIEPLLIALDATDAKLQPLSIVGPEHRLYIANARAQLAELVRSVETTTKPNWGSA